MMGLPPIRELDEKNKTNNSFMKKPMSVKKPNVANKSQNSSLFKSKPDAKIKGKSKGLSLIHI